MSDVTCGRVGSLEREGPCQFCGLNVCQYEVVGEPGRSFFEHERPWCEEYTAIAAQNGLSAEHNPKDDDGDSEN